MSRILRSSMMVALTVLGAAGISPTAAQITTTGIRGLVRDPNGAVVPNASVKVKDNSTEVEQPPSLPPRVYSFFPTCSLVLTS